MNKRRKLVIALGASALASPLSLRAQPQTKVWRIGYLAYIRRPASLESGYISAFPQGMRDLGYVEGKNLVIERRFADSTPERLAGLAAELVQMKPDLLVAGNSPAISALQKATSNIPIVMGAINDPVGSGFVKSLAHPGGNITGLSVLSVDISPKLIEMLRNTVPKLSRVAVLVNPSNLSHATLLKNMQAAANTVSVKLLRIEAQIPQKIENAFFTMGRERPGAVIIVQDPLFIQQAGQIAELALKVRLPSIAGFQEFPEAGGLMSYGTNLAALYRRMATYVDKIFKGANPADLPVEQPTKFELVINGNTAKALGLTIPQSLLISADKVIE